MCGISFRCWGRSAGKTERKDPEVFCIPFYLWPRCGNTHWLCVSLFVVADNFHPSASKQKAQPQTINRVVVVRKLDSGLSFDQCNAEERRPPCPRIMMSANKSSQRTTTTIQTPPPSSRLQVVPLTVGLLEARAGTLTTELLGLATTGIGDEKSAVELDESGLQGVLGVLIDVLGVVGNL